MSTIDATTIPAGSGKTPDLLLERPGATAAPLDLPRLVMRRARVVAITFLILALVLGLLAARSDTRDEIDGALSLARMSLRLRDLPADDAQALAALQSSGRLRHVQLRVADADGHALLDTAAPPLPAPLRGLMRATLHSAVAPTGQSVSWPVLRPGNRAWTLTLTAAPESEQREALTNLLGLFGLLAACCLLMLAVMNWNVRRAFRPLQALLGAIARIEHQDLEGVKTLPPMPIRELAVVSQALRQLASSLEQAEAARRVLAHKILTLQEDERQRLARDLHDEFGQRLTGLRVDAAWLRKRLARDPEAAPVVDGMSEQIAHIQRDVRDLLARLQPLGAAGEPLAATEDVATLTRLLESLAASWSRSNGTGLHCEARVTRHDVSTAPVPALPRDVVLTLYRISQEAFTNAARHGGATTARVEVDIDVRADATVELHWRARDDGAGLASPQGALQRGNGLAGMKERVWAHGGEFEWTATNPAPMRGLELRARLAFALA